MSQAITIKLPVPVLERVGRDLLVLPKAGLGGERLDNYFPDVDSALIDDMLAAINRDISFTVRDGRTMIKGTAGADVMLARGRPFQISAGDGNDVVMAGAGRDWLFGDGGDDYLSGGAGGDVLSGLTGADLLDGGEGDDKLFGGAGDDRLIGGSGNDSLFGGSGDDRLYGDAGNDRVEGGEGNDRLFGGAGNDYLYGGQGNDRLGGGPGDDTYMFWRGDGQDRIYNGRSEGEADVMQFRGGIEPEHLWFRRLGEDLEVSLVGTEEAVTFVRWYAADPQRVDRVELRECKDVLRGIRYLEADAIEALVQAMSAFSPPPSGSTSLPDDYRATLDAVLAAHWE